MAFVRPTSVTRSRRNSAIVSVRCNCRGVRDIRRLGDPSHYFRMMKELALLGYFTSEIGYTKAQRYAESPGRFDPCLPHKPRELSWTSHA
ncbi:MAG TPA: gluconate 2-dehydrogenase subunit 3 family protein [Gemmatimonadaceae bacterium]|nr:gluconate 2-dehydrogenase subunit 3 family protein [Gemmatimonadaceae bacterium]